MRQFFKGDEQEQKFFESGDNIVSQLSAGKSEFFAGAYTTAALGDLLYDTARAPLSNAIPRDIFRTSFSVIFDAFLVAGSFESYLTVFRNIFGNDVDVEFTVPDPGKLNIDITAAGSELNDFVARVIEAGNLVLHEVVDEEGDNIAFQTIKGFESQYELEKMLFEMVPGGIYTQISLTIGGL